MSGCPDVTEELRCA